MNVNNSYSFYLFLPNILSLIHDADNNPLWFSLDHQKTTSKHFTTTSNQRLVLCEDLISVISYISSSLNQCSPFNPPVVLVCIPSLIRAVHRDAYGSNYWRNGDLTDYLQVSMHLFFVLKIDHKGIFHVSNQ